MLDKLTTLNQKVSPGLRKILNNIGWLFADRILRLGVNLFVTAWIARYLQPQQFGLYNYALAFTALFSTLGSLGLDQILVRELVRAPECKDETLGTALALRLAGMTAAISLMIATIHLLRPGDSLTHWLVGLISIGGLFEAFGGTIDFWFQRQVQSKYTVIARNTAFIIATLLRISLILLKAPLIAFAWALLAETALSVVGLAIVYRFNQHTWRTWQVSLSRAKSLLTVSWPLVISGLAIMIYLRIDQIMLGQLAGDRAVGIYSVTTKISELWYYIPTAIISSVTPSIIQTREGSKDLYYQRLQKLFNLMAVLAYSIALPMTFLSTNLVTLIFGQDYTAAGPVLSVHIWSALFVFFGWTKAIWIITEGYTVYALISTCCGALMNILLNFWLIPAYQEMGAAIATVVSYAFTDYLLCFIYPPARRLAGIMTRAMTLTTLLSKKPLND